jgi:hypothetical protein
MAVQLPPEECYIRFEQQVDDVFAPAFGHDVEDHIAQSGIRSVRTRRRRLPQKAKELREQ